MILIFLLKILVAVISAGLGAYIGWKIGSCIHKFYLWMVS